MLHLHDFQQPMPQKRVFGRRMINGINECRVGCVEDELRHVEMEIAFVTNKSRRLAEELGERYIVFRGGCLTHCSGAGDEEIMRLSKETDECIEKVYNLEKRRRELLEMIGK